ncbi:haloacid dehalogenase superfamily protein, subfamily IA, variant 3 with third motif having DD or ED [Terriglobus roseus DSM 18391]|uniref:Haloacid dehalogenase superfamily protein, subfamily IA, variant 3 with third motif having DD or ED n=1 Tax=Terriglobus roseus (strain DSM 18391 / NRRL B-41598 / KBS 63) TaxID=926566 RepID=I3ZDJ9_TERRK|nr:HAD-IA family hydrolase [Terriglobus roseus]AFL87317.1 haloacid dehalogenase superfamily protein, subfamily IA, variant 3 with third motif having DD or ED [Terriglobus roseus DSM 18391]
MKIRTVFWDIGGVLLTNGFGRTQRAGFYEALGFSEDDKADFERLRVDANWHWERGLIDADEFFRRTVFFKPRAFSQADVWGAVEQQQRLLEAGALGILQALHARGNVRQAALNNESRELNEYRLNRFSLRKYFQFCICSGYVHEMKPAPGIYRSAFEIGGDVPGEALFIDDKAENIEAANAAGLIGLHFVSPAELREELQSHGVEL